MEKIILGKQLSAPQAADFLKLYECDGNEILLADWSGVLDAGRARLGCTAILNALSQQPFPKILNNNSKVTGHYPGAIDWVGKVWFPEMYKLGVRYFAWVYSPAFYTQIGTDEIIKLSSKVEIQTFYEINQAYDWLLEKKVSV
ncbi:hypothetical protein H8S95_04820 [Pontibacter sp. KCTC 32443]|uniref:hypothetical protein n=1 Tax=Pontibacter TaxID=323449 RepID=UPI00164EBAEF|nr:MULTISPECIES: hypothetical protein [Pontibacter]MBC5773379.1 hypothetical protein [Pontibacter sp. KCTC 32443]